MANPLYQKHIISINDLSRDDLNLVLATAAKLKANPQPELLKHKVIASCFFEASTRTRLSFETSMHRLGASVVGFSDSANTSLGKKGETLADTISVISTYVDAIVMRHPQEGAARLATEFSGNVPVLNAGDGSNQHPTQTLLDLFTIQETQGRLDNLHVAMVGDLKYGRTVHSLTQALAKFDGNRFYFIAPDALAMPQYILDMLDEKGIAWSLHSSIEEVMAEVDILYMTRVQKERLDPSEYANVKAQFVLRASDLHNKIVAASATAAAAAGASPIPFSDAVILAPIQVGMIAGITSVFGLELSKGTLTTLVASAIGVGGATFLGRTVVVNILKFFPGVGTVAGGAISAATASAITVGLGEAYITVLAEIFTQDPDAEPTATEIGEKLKEKMIKMGS